MCPEGLSALNSSVRFMLYEHIRMLGFGVSGFRSHRSETHPVVQPKTDVSQIVYVYCFNIYCFVELQQLVNQHKINQQLL